MFSSVLCQLNWVSFYNVYNIILNNHSDFIQLFYRRYGSTKLKKKKKKRHVVTCVKFFTQNYSHISASCLVLYTSHLLCWDDWDEVGKSLLPAMLDVQSTQEQKQSDTPKHIDSVTVPQKLILSTLSIFLYLYLSYLFLIPSLRPL